MRVLLLLIAASALQAQPSVPTWTLSARPTLEIGNESNTQTQFNGVTGIVRMPGGEIVVANSLSQELRVFSPTGAYLRTLTAETSAGQMRALDRIWRGGDTIYASEVLPTESSVWIFTLAGFVGRRPVGSSNAGGIAPIGRFPDGRFVITAAPRRPVQNPVGLTFIDSLPIGILSLAELGSPRWIGWLKNEMVMVQTIGGGGRGRGARMTPMPYPYGRSVSYAVAGDRLWIGDTETGTITQHTSNGQGLAVFSVPIPERQLDTTAIRRIRTSLLSDAMNWTDRSRVEAFYSVPFPRRAPRFRRLLSGANGEMWIELFREDTAAPLSYIVMNRAGATVGRLTLPPRVTPLAVGPDEILGVRTDADGLEHVVRYALRRGI